MLPMSLRFALAAKMGARGEYLKKQKLAERERRGARERI
jgi:hypothetical protein